MERREGVRKLAVGLSLAAGVAAAGILARRRPRPPAIRFNAAYREDVRLRDGTRVILRLVRPRDKRRLEEGLRRLSAESRYQRFHAPKAAFTARELQYLTETDGRSHLALGALLASNPREGLAVARFVGGPRDPRVADAAIVVRDDMQLRGLGSVLLDRLADAARERGIRTLRFEVLSANVAMIRLLRRVFGQVRQSREGFLTIAEADLEPAGPAA